MYLFAITLFMPAGGNPRFLQQEPASSPSLTSVHVNWACLGVVHTMIPGEKG